MEESEIILNRQLDSDGTLATCSEVIGDAGEKRLDQGLAVLGRPIDPIAGLAQSLEQPHRARRRVQADAVGDPAVAIGIVGEHDRDPPQGDRRGAEPRPGGRQLRREPDPVGGRSEAHDVGLGRGIEALSRLERDRAAEHPAVDLGQGDVHRQIARRQAARAGPPPLLAAAGEHDLKHGAVRLVQGRGAPRPRARDGKTGGVQHHRRLRLPEPLADQRRGDGVLEAGGEDRQRVQPRFAQRGDQGIDDLEVARLHQGSVKHEGGDRPVRLPVRPHAIEIRARQARPVQAGAQERRRLPPCLVRPSRPAA